MSVVTHKKSLEGKKVLEMIEWKRTIIPALQRDFNEHLPERMQTEVLLNMTPADLQNSII